MLYEFISKVAEEDASKKLSKKMEWLPSDVLYKIATGELKLGGYGDENVAEWLSSYSGTPLYQQAFDIENQLLQMEAAYQQEEQRNRPMQETYYAQRSMLESQKKLLDLQLSQFREQERNEAMSQEVPIEQKVGSGLSSYFGRLQREHTKSANFDFKNFAGNALHHIGQNPAQYLGVAGAALGAGKSLYEGGGLLDAAMGGMAGAGIGAGIGGALQPATGRLSKDISKGKTVEDSIQGQYDRLKNRLFGKSAPTSTSASPTASTDSAAASATQQNHKADASIGGSTGQVPSGGATTSTAVNPGGMTAAGGTNINTVHGAVNPGSVTGVSTQQPPPNVVTNQNASKTASIRSAWFRRVRA